MIDLIFNAFVAVTIVLSPEPVGTQYTVETPDASVQLGYAGFTGQWMPLKDCSNQCVLPPNQTVVLVQDFPLDVLADYSALIKRNGVIVAECYRFFYAPVCIKR